jgi:hypothetical protein
MTVATRFPASLMGEEFARRCLARSRPCRQPFSSASASRRSRGIGLVPRKVGRGTSDRSGGARRRSTEALTVCIGRHPQAGLGTPGLALAGLGTAPELAPGLAGRDVLVMGHMEVEMEIAMLLFWLLLMAFASTVRWLAISGRTRKPGGLLDLVNELYGLSRYRPHRTPRTEPRARAGHDPVTLGSMLSFPASDPPSWMGSTTSAGPPGRPREGPVRRDVPEEAANGYRPLHASST